MTYSNGLARFKLFAKRVLRWQSDGLVSIELLTLAPARCGVAS